MEEVTERGERDGRIHTSHDSFPPHLHPTHLLLPHPDDRLFLLAQKNFLDMESAMIKLHTHFEKQLQSMQDSMFHQYTISHDLSYFYCSKGSPFTKGVDEYRTKSSE